MNPIVHNLLKTGLSLAILAGASLSVAHAVTVDPLILRDHAVAHVKSRLADLIAREDLSRIEVSVLNIPGGAMVMKHAEKQSDLKIQADSSLGTVYSSRAIVRLNVSDGVTSRQLGIPVSIQIKKPVWIVKNGVDAKAPLKRSDFVLESRDVSANYGYAIGTERELSDYIARVNLRPGEWLDTRKVSIPPDVTRNSDVRIIMTNGQGMTVTVAGVAIDEGRIGQTIKVRQQMNQKKTYSAKIIASHRVQVDI